MEEDSFKILKFTPPDPPVGFVPRPRLSQTIAMGLQGQMVLLSAPAGYGKTSLLAYVASEWGRFVGDPTAVHLAWYQLDPADDDAAVFVSGLVEAIRRVVPGFGETVRAALRATADGRGEIGRLIALFLDELHRVEPEQVVLILDGLHHLTDRAIVEALEQLLLGAGSPLRLIVASQTDPHLYLSMLRARDALVELRTEDLQWNPEELRRLALQRVGRTVPQRVLDDLMRATGGWPSAANLASMIVARDPNNAQFLVRLAPTEHGYGVLLREVLFGLPAERREEVLRSSLLTRLDPESCLDGVGVSDPEALLRSIEEASLPVMRPAGRDLPLCYEPFFRSALQQELARQLLPREHQDLRRKVAAYYAARGEISEALPRYLQMGDYEEAATLLERTMVTDRWVGAVDVSLRWLRSLPASVREKHPALMVQEAEMLLARERVDEARVLLVASQPGLEASGDSRSRGQQLRCKAAAHLLEGRYPSARDSAREALRHLPEGDNAQRAGAFWLESRALEFMGDLASSFSAAAEGLLEAERSSHPQLAVRALMQLAMVAYLRGDYSRALALSGRAVQRARLLGMDVVAISDIGGPVSSIYLDRGQRQEALAVAEIALAASEKLRDEFGQLRALLVQAATLEGLAQREAAGEILAGVLDRTSKLPARRSERTLALQAVSAFLLRRGRQKEGLGKARRAMEEATASSHQILIDQCCLIEAAGQMSGPRMPMVLARIRRLNDTFKRSDNRRWLSAGHRLLAQGYGQLGLRWQARSHLRTSLAIAAEQSYVSMPLGLPVKADRLFLLAVREGVAHEVAGTLLGVDPASGSRLLDPLLHQKNPERRSRAEQAAKGSEKGLGGAVQARLGWPGGESGERRQEPAPAEEGRERVDLRSLGDFHAVVGGERVEWASEDARDLAAYLLVHRTVAMLRERVLHDLWTDEDPAIANVRLHEALYRIRESFGPGFPPVDPALDGEGVYRWEGAGCAMDVESFRDLLGRVRRLLDRETPPVLSGQVVSLLQQAVELYQGEFLGGFAFPWCEAPREELRGLLLWATRLLIDHQMALQGWREAIRYGLKSLKSDPLQEDVVRDLMVCYFRAGDRGAVDRQYRELKRLLARDRGAAPSEETRQLRFKLLGTGAGWARIQSLEPAVMVVGKQGGGVQGSGLRR